MSNLSINLKKFTWDYPNKTFSEEEFLHSPEFISRILKYGDIKNWVWVIKGNKGARHLLVVCRGRPCVCFFYIRKDNYIL